MGLELETFQFMYNVLIQKDTIPIIFLIFC